MELWEWKFAVASEEKIDWAECPLVDIKPEVQSGAPVLRGTRMPVSAVVDNFDYGLSVGEIAEQFEISVAHVEAVVNYAKSRRVAGFTSGHPIGRRDVIAMLGGAAMAWPLASRAQQPPRPVIGFLYSGDAEGLASFMPGYRQGLSDTGFVEGKNVAIEYRLAEGHFESLPDLARDFVRRGVDLISTGGGVPPIKAA